MKTMTALIILDGFGVNAETKANPVATKRPIWTPYLPSIPTRLAASGWRWNSERADGQFRGGALWTSAPAAWCIRS